MSLIAPKLQEFYEEGLLKLLTFIPANLAREERLIIEGVVYTAYGLYRSYSLLENYLDSITSDNGEASTTAPSRHRDAFLFAWSAVDTIYALHQLKKAPMARALVARYDEISCYATSAARLRNFMDHLINNLKNFSQSKNSPPLFGWLTYQFTPSSRNVSLPSDVYYINNLGSTYINGTIHLSAPELSSIDVFSSIDNIVLHARSDRLNLSQVFRFLTLIVNDFSINAHNRMMKLFENVEFDHGGLKIPFQQATIRADLHGQVVIHRGILPMLNENKVRVNVTLDTRPD